MASSVEWLDEQWDRLLLEQRRTADSTKLLATFTSAIAAALLAASLQVADSLSGLAVGAVLTFGISGFLTLAVMAMDRLAVPDHGAALLDHAIAPMTDIQLVAAFRKATITSVIANDQLLDKVRGVAVTQTVFAALSTGLSIALLVQLLGQR